MAGTPQIKTPSRLAPFASPDDFDQDLQEILEKATSKLCKWLSCATQRGPLPKETLLPEVPPLENGLSSEELLADIGLIMDGSYQPSNPGALAHLDPPPLTSSIVAELICAGLNNNLLAEELSPSLSKLERELCKWFAKRLGLSSLSGGVAASGGSLSNLMALVVARHQSNLQTDPSAFVLASNESHVSLAKAMRVMGMHSDSLQLVPTNSQGQISISDLERRFLELVSEGRKCLAVVATAGTTVRGAVDPLQSIGEFCAINNLWMHVDGAIGGVFALPDSTNSLVKGIERADSITLNPQKLLGIPKASSLLLVDDSSHLLTAFSTGLPYIDPPWGDAHGGEMGIQGTRSAETLKLWLGLRQLGENGIRLVLDSALARARYFKDQLDQSNFLIESGPLHLVAFTPKDMDKVSSSEWSLITRKKLLEHDFMLSRPLHHDRHFLKAVFGNPHTKEIHLKNLADIINRSV